MHMLDSPKSGRSGDVVFFMIRNRQRERTYVVPKNVQCRSGSGHPSPLRAVALLPRLRTLPEPRRIGHWRELWHGG